MEENVYYANLFDIYGELLTDKQQKYFKYYYFENLLLDEISEICNVSKNAVSKEIKRAKEMLEYYEEKLHILKFNENLYKEFKNDEDILRRIENCLNTTPAP